MASSTVIPQIGSLLIDFDSFMVVILSLLLLLNLDFLRVGSTPGPGGETRKWLSQRRARRCGLNRLQEKEERGSGAPGQDTPRA